MLRASVLPFVVCASALLFACADPPVHPGPPPRLDGSFELGCSPSCWSPPIDGGPVDLGTGDDGGDTDGSVDGGVTGFCGTFPRAGNSVAQPIGFMPTHIVARWNTDSCAVPELIVALTEGECDLDDGERFELRVSEAALADGTISVGVNTLFDGIPSALRMQYVRDDAPSATVGPCGVGTVTINMLSFARDSRFTATFDVTLDDCSLSGDSGFALFGSFDVPVLESSADACP